MIQIYIWNVHVILRECFVCFVYLFVKPKIQPKNLRYSDGQFTIQFWTLIIYRKFTYFSFSCVFQQIMQCSVSVWKHLFFPLFLLVFQFFCCVFLFVSSLFELLKARLCSNQIKMLVLVLFFVAFVDDVSWTWNFISAL